MKMKTEIKLQDTIREDCKTYLDMVDPSRFYHTLCLVEYPDSPYSSLFYDGEELYWGTLEEINAVVKSMIRLVEWDRTHS